ncbi:hypothetical protein [Sphingobacterium thermophilum]|uniref:Uncharacterized protein n=1 Tax=Sphingobacterium thermophilum TaxID=768534 RepID=A0ABP8QWG2_9SPHI
MKIVPIFADKLFAFHYDGEVDNEYDRLLELWTDTEYVRAFLQENKEDIPPNYSIRQYVAFIREDAIEIDEQLIAIAESGDDQLEQFFQPLRNSEYQIRVLSSQKGRKNCLRLYAIRIDENVFVITGGAIKLPRQHCMEDREHTRVELRKLEKAKDFLKLNGIFDEDSFFEFLKY